MITAAVFAASAEDVRFSQQLSASQRLECGLQRLSSDQLAVLDALVRRDENWNVKPKAAPPAIPRFSQRLSSDERRTAGLETLDRADLFNLDDCVAQIEFGTSQTQPAGSSADASLQPQIQRPRLEVHGMLTFVVGGGSGGRSEMGGSMAFMVADPAHNLSVFVDYEEMHAKSSLSGRGCYGDPRYRSPMDAFLQPER
jgi:hypothetical protein